MSKNKFIIQLRNSFDYPSPSYYGGTYRIYPDHGETYRIYPDHGDSYLIRKFKISEAEAYDTMREAYKQFNKIGATHKPMILPIPKTEYFKHQLRGT